MLMFILTLVATYCLMEGVAWFSHKYIMHGILWKLHKDHHRKDHQHFLERNDSFFVLFAIPAMLCFVFGSLKDYNLLIAVGSGISLYGITYFLVHDVFIHQRFGWFKKTNNAYFRAVRRTHKLHHKNINKEDGEYFGMLWVPIQFIKNELLQNSRS